MNEAVHHYIRAKNIDSFQKLRLLLFLYQNPRLKVTSQELVHWLHLGDTLLIETLLADLHQAGLVIQIGIYYQLADEPEVKLHLQQLASAFEHPVMRQELLKQVKPKPAHRLHTDLPSQWRWQFN